MKPGKCLTVLILLFSTGVAQERIPKNIILMIGDGMGISQVTAGRTYKGSLELDKFRTLGLLLTHAYGKYYVTDSAAGATALSSGVKTYNGAIGVGPDTTKVETALERAEKLGKKTGIVVSCSITHATPASFVAHVPNRAMQLEIAEQMSSADVDIYLGSGWGWFLPQSKGGRRTDGRDLVATMQKRGYVYVSSDSGFRSLDLTTSEKILGLFAKNHVPEAQKRVPSLVEMTAKAISFLSGSANGFFLMVEGSQIDWAGHDNKSDQIAVEMADFDDAIGEALRFAQQNPETLIIVTADHETGGYSLVGGSREKRQIEGKFIYGGHTAAMVPLFSTGPSAERFAGIQENSNVGKILLELLK